MKDISYLKSLHDEILAYTKAHDDLSESHHWLFDLPPFKDELFNPKHIVFGINPGEGKERLCLTQTEETRFFDCHEEYSGKGAREKIGWTKKLLNILETRRIIQTELFFWSISVPLRALCDSVVFRPPQGPPLDRSSSAIR